MRFASIRSWYAFCTFLIATRLPVSWSTADTTMPYAPDPICRPENAAQWRQQDPSKWLVVGVSELFPRAHTAAPCQPAAALRPRIKIVAWLQRSPATAPTGLMIRYLDEMLNSVPLTTVFVRGYAILSSPEAWNRE
jgi:hypothetical protein